MSADGQCNWDNLAADSKMATYVSYAALAHGPDVGMLSHPAAMCLEALGW